MKTKTLSYTPILFCILILWSACKDDADAPLRFYDSKYEVPMGGRRYLGIESGNGDYSLEIGNPRIASAGIESGWSGVPAGRMIYISGILTGSTYLKVTDNATQETLTLPIKVVDYYEDLNLIHGSSCVPMGTRTYCRVLTTFSLSATLPVTLISSNKDNEPLFHRDSN